MPGLSRCIAPKRPGPEPLRMLAWEALLEMELGAEPLRWIGKIWKRSVLSRFGITSTSASTRPGWRTICNGLWRCAEGLLLDGCSSCGVCGPELGHNVVVPAPEVPTQVPTQAPPSDRVCRLRVRFAKTGSMALLSHLDLMRLLERALRRSGLPISFTGGFHPLPRIQIALALPLGAEAKSEWMDLEFIQALDPHHFSSTLQPLLPEGIQLLAAAEVPVSGRSLSQELTGAVWCFDLVPEAQLQRSVEWSAAVNQLLQAKALVWHDTDKKGRPRERDCRPALNALQVTDEDLCGSARLRLEAAVDEMGRSLRPSQIQHWLSEILGQPLELQRLSREALLLSAQC